MLVSERMYKPTARRIAFLKASLRASSESWPIPEAVTVIVSFAGAGDSVAVEGVAAGVAGAGGFAAVEGVAAGVAGASFAGAGDFVTVEGVDPGVADASFAGAGAGELSAMEISQTKTMTVTNLTTKILLKNKLIAKIPFVLCTNPYPPQEGRAMDKPVCRLSKSLLFNKRYGKNLPSWE